MNNIKNRLINILLITTMFMLSALPIMLSVQFNPSQTISLMFSNEHLMWTLMTLSLIAYGLIVKGWNNTKVIRSYCVLSILGLITFYYIYLNFADHYYLRIISLPLGSVFLFVYFRYRHIFRLLYTRWAVKFCNTKHKEKLLNTYSSMKTTTLEVYLYYFTLAVFLVDTTLALYLSVYQAYFQIDGPIYLFIEEKSHFDPFIIYNYFHRYVALVTAICLIVLMALEIKTPDHSGKPQVVLPKVLIRLLKFYRLNRLRR